MQKVPDRRMMVLPIDEEFAEDISWIELEGGHYKAVLTNIIYDVLKSKAQFEIRLQATINELKEELLIEFDPEEVELMMESLTNFLKSVYRTLISFNEYKGDEHGYNSVWIDRRPTYSPGLVFSLELPATDLEDENATQR